MSLISQRTHPIVALVAVVITAVVAVAADQHRASAAVATYPVMNTSETLPDGVWFRNSPSNSDTNRETGFGVYKGESIAVDCWAWGDAVGSYNNHIWYRGLNATRPTVNGHSNYGYLNTHYVNDGMTADHAAPGVPSCSTPPPPPPPPPPPARCVNGIKWSKQNLTWFYGGAHRYKGNAYQGMANWSNLRLGFTFTEVSSAKQANIVFEDVNDRRNAGIYASAQTQPNTSDLSTVPPTFRSPSTIKVLVNQAAMDSIVGTDQHKDFVKTFTMTHEIGHVLGLGHTDKCGVSDTSVMRAGTGGWFLSAGFNTPQAYDAYNLQQLYPATF